MTAIELFKKLYNNEINDSECISIIHPDEENHYILRDKSNKFNEVELFNNLMFKEYTFEIVNQEEIQKELDKQSKLKKIAKLKQELKELEENM